MTQEQEIKHFLLPYQSILKLTDTSSIIDNTPLIPEPPREDLFAWRELDYECEYDGYSV